MSFTVVGLLLIVILIAHLSEGKAARSYPAMPASWV